MFNYPISILKVNKKYKCFSPKELSNKRFKYAFIELDNYNYEVNNNIHSYDIKFKEDFSSTEEQSRLWAELTISLEEFKPTLNWIKFPKKSLILPILNKVKKEDVTPTQMEMIIEYILHRPEESYIDYVELILIHNGINGIYDNLTQLEKMCLDSTYIMENFTNRPIINEHNFSDIDKYAYDRDSLIDKFLIKTNGFNQCFRYEDENYSSVSVVKYEEGYGIYI